MQDIRMEKTLEALIDDAMNEMGRDAAGRCYVLRRLQDVMLEMKSSNNAEILREIGGHKREPFDESRCGECRRC